MRLIAWTTSTACALLLLLGGGLAPANAGPAFLLTGAIDFIDQGDVDAAGASSRFVVKDRHIGGQLSGVIGDQVLTDVRFQFTFGTNVPLTTQSGNLHGTLAFDGFQARVAAKTTLGLTPLPCDPSTTPGCVAVPGGGFLPGLLLRGTLVFPAAGQGTVEGFVIPILDAQGHIVAAFGQVTLASK